MIKSDCSTITTVTKTTVSPHIWQDLQDAVNAGLDIAKRDFPVGTIIDYPYMLSSANRPFRLKVVVADYNALLPTIYGSAPGLILQHIVAHPREAIFNQLGRSEFSRSNRYLGSSICQFLLTDDRDGFQAGIPNELREIVTPLRLEVPIYGENEVAAIDIVEMPFFLPSLEEVGFNAVDKEYPALWQFFRDNPKYRFKDYNDHYVGCWLRSASRSDGGRALAVCAGGDIHSYSVFDIKSCAPACAIAQKH